MAVPPALDQPTTLTERHEDAPAPAATFRLGLAGVLAALLVASLGVSVWLSATRGFEAVGVVRAGVGGDEGVVTIAAVDHVAALPFDLVAGDQVIPYNRESLMVALIAGGAEEREFRGRAGVIGIGVIFVNPDAFVGVIHEAAVIVGDDGFDFLLAAVPAELAN